MRFHLTSTAHPRTRRWLWLRRTGVAVAAAGALTAVLAPVTASAAPGAGGPPVPALAWHRCASGFACATARVPLDYRHPHGATIRLLVFRHRATDPAHRLGTLFVNGGGPSAQYRNVTGGYTAIPAALRARYDIIGFDPRGFGASTPVRCFPDTAAENRFLSALPGGFPVGARQIAVWDRTWARFDTVCAHRVPAGLLAHDSTADVARDMDLLRQAVGAKMLNYYGLSYGTALGTIYANLFPVRVGRMVLDGNLDPVAYTTADHTYGLPMFLRDREDQASAATLRAFLDLCGQAPATACAFTAGTPAATRAKFATLLRRLRAHPAPIPGSSQTCGFACAVESVPLTEVSKWHDGARVLQQLWAATATHADTAAALPAASARPAWPPLQQPAPGGRPAEPVRSNPSPSPAPMAPTPGTRPPTPPPPAWPMPGPAQRAACGPGPPRPARTGPPPRTGTPARGTGAPPTPSCCSPSPATPTPPTGTPSRCPTTWPAPGCSPSTATATPNSPTPAPAPPTTLSATCSPASCPQGGPFASRMAHRSASRHADTQPPAIRPGGDRASPGLMAAFAHAGALTATPRLSASHHSPPPAEQAVRIDRPFGPESVRFTAPEQVCEEL